MDDELFRGARLKVKRANKHIDELRATVNTFLQTNFYRLSLQKDSHGMHHIKFEQVGALPEETPTIIGDALHNLRAALDLAVCEAVTVTGGTPSNYTRFPFAEDREKLIGPLEKGVIKASCPAIYDFIVDDLKPYKGGNDTLYALHNFDIMDKHKLLIPIVSIIALSGVGGEDDRGGSFRELNLQIAQGGKLNVLSNANNVKITNYGKPSFQILFNKGQILEGEPVIPTLNNFSQLISSIVDSFEQICLERQD